MATLFGNMYQSEEDGSRVEEKIEALRDSGRPVNILVIGPTKVGKSTLVNAMLGMDVAEIGHGAGANRSEVEEHEGEYEGVRIKFCVTVGYRVTGRKRDYSVLLDIDNHIHFDLILICTRLEDRADRDMFVELASVLNKEMWKRTVVVLTQANQFDLLQSVDDKSQMTMQRDDHKECVVEFLSGRINKEVLERIPFCLAGIEDEKELPTTDDWVKTLWDTCIDRCSDESHPLLSFYVRHRKRIMTVSAGALVGVVTLFLFWVLQ